MRMYVSDCMRCGRKWPDRPDCGIRTSQSAIHMRVDPNRPDPRAIRQAVETVRAGGIIGYPTETVYGLGADPYDEAAVQRVFELKGREARKGLVLVVPDERILMRIVDDISPAARTLMTTFWPGPLTLVFRARPDLPKSLLGGGDTVAVRRTSDPVARALLGALQGPLISTSANRAGEPPYRSAAEVARGFGDRLDLILDDGATREQVPSSIVDVSSDETRWIRAGAVTRAEIERVLERPLGKGRG